MFPGIKNHIPAVALALMALTALPGCFTGVERTPVIKDPGARNSADSKPTAEQLLMEPVRPEAPAQWRHGKPFVVADGRLDYAYSPMSAASALSAGDTLRFVGFRSAARLAGDSITEIVLSTLAGSELVTRIEAPLAQVMAQPSVSVPFTVEASLVDSARSLLRNRRVWTLRPNARGGRKFREVAISDVLPGNADYPFVVVAGGDSLLMVPNSRSASARTFANLFSLTNPRKQYPQITDANWELITQGKVAIDMTREECRLALGAPAQLERDALPTALYERWIYEDGVYLFFTDGLLSRFRQ